MTKRGISTPPRADASAASGGYRRDGRDDHHRRRFEASLLAPMVVVRGKPL